MSEGRPLRHDEIRAYLLEVAEEMPASDLRHVIVMVGGALLSWYGLREATRDVDSVQRLDDELREAVRVVADRHGLAPAWVNDSAAGFVPQTFVLAECDVLLDHPRLRVLGAPPRQVFLMKVFAGRDQDEDDLVALWPLVGFTPEQVVAEFWLAYPAAPDDEFLISWIEDIAAQASATEL
jgi:hypothetical protein